LPLSPVVVLSQYPQFLVNVANQFISIDTFALPATLRC
jgi:hypothetical protein